MNSSNISINPIINYSDGSINDTNNKSANNNSKSKNNNNTNHNLACNSKT